MMPNLGRMNPAMMKKLKKQMGTKEMDDVTEVIIKRPGETLIFKRPAVAEMNMMGQRMYQVIGEPEVFRGALPGSDVTAGAMPESDEPMIPEEDVALVAERAGVSQEEALAALKKSEGDIAEAIMSFL